MTENTEIIKSSTALEASQDTNSSIITDADLIETPQDSIALESNDYIFHKKGRLLPLAEKILCLDLTDKHFKYAIFARKGNRVKWLNVGELPEFPLNDQDIEQVAANGLEVLLSKINLKKTKTLIVIDGADFFLRKVETPILKGADLLEAVKWECSKQIPYPIEDAYINIIDAENTEDSIIVFTAIVNKSSIDKFSFLGDKLLGVIPSPLALRGCFHNEPESHSTTDILIHWGTSDAVIDFISDNKLKFCSSFKLIGLKVDGFEFESLNIADKIESNLKNCLDFYQSIYPGQQITEIKMHGIGYEPVLERINRATSIDVSYNNPYDSFLNDREELHEFWDISKSNFLLSAGAVQLSPQSVYLPSDVEQIYKLNRLKTISKYLSLLVILSIIVFGQIFIMERTVCQNANQAIQQQKNDINNSPSYNEAMLLKQGVDSRMLFLSRFGTSSKWVANYLKAASLAVSSGVYFNLMELVKNQNSQNKINLRIEGYYYGDFKKADMKLAKLMETLNQYCIFEKKKLERLGERMDGSQKHTGFVISGVSRSNR